MEAIEKEFGLVMDLLRKYLDLKYKDEKRAVTRFQSNFQSQRASAAKEESRLTETEIEYQNDLKTLNQFIELLNKPHLSEADYLTELLGNIKKDLNALNRLIENPEGLESEVVDKDLNSKITKLQDFFSHLKQFFERSGFELSDIK